jgi:glycosyltransferase involved in cell wall biosynthesis
MSIDAMHVDLVSHNPIGQVSGIGRYTRELLHHLSPHVDVRLTQFADPPLATHLSVLHNFPVGIKNRRRGSIVHFTQIMGSAVMLWRPVRPAIATVHDLGVLVCKEDEALFSPLDRRILDVHLAGLRRMDQFIVHSERTRAGLMTHLAVSSQRISVVPSSVDSGHFRPIEGSGEVLASRYGIPPDETGITLLNVGSELPRKNLGLLLRAMAVLRGQGHQVRLIKVGGAGGDRWRLRFLADIAEAGLEGSVTIVNAVPEDDLPLFYNAADICVTTTLLEGGFAWLAMEGMACGRPVIASTGALIPPSASEAAIIVPDRDLDALVRALERCIQAPGLRQRLGDLGRKIITSFSWDNEARAVIDVYRQMIRV